MATVEEQEKLLQVLARRMYSSLQEGGVKSLSIVQQVVESSIYNYSDIFGQHTISHLPILTKWCVHQKYAFINKCECTHTNTRTPFNETMHRSQISCRKQFLRNF